MAKRPDLAAFGPKPGARPAPAKVVPIGGNASAPAEAPKPKGRPSSITVYLPQETIRQLKLIAIETPGLDVSGIGATAINEWLERNGHKRR